MTIKFSCISEWRWCHDSLSDSVWSTGGVSVLVRVAEEYVSVKCAVSTWWHRSSQVAVTRCSSLIPLTTATATRAQQTTTNIYLQVRSSTLLYGCLLYSHRFRHTFRLPSPESTAVSQLIRTFHYCTAYEQEAQNSTLHPIFDWITQPISTSWYLSIIAKRSLTTSIDGLRILVVTATDVI